MGRKHIHFAKDEHLMRKGKSVLIECNMEYAMNDGIKFYRSSNGVILTSGINGFLDAKYLIIHDIKDKRKSKETERNGK